MGSYIGFAKKRQKENKTMKNMKTKLVAIVLTCAVVVPSAFAVDPTFSDVTTAAQSGILGFLSANATGLFGILVLTVAFGMAVKWTRRLGK